MNRSMVIPRKECGKSLVASEGFAKLERNGVRELERIASAKWGSRISNEFDLVNRKTSHHQNYIPLARRSDLLVNLKANASETFSTGSRRK